MKSQLSLKAYVARRILGAVPSIFFIVSLTFLIIQLAPGDPVQFFVGEAGASSPDLIERVRYDFGLDKPLLERYTIYVANVLHGDLGYSFTVYTGLPVTYVLSTRIPPTLLLIGTSTVIATILGILAGVLAAKKAHSMTDNLVTTVSLLVYSVPEFWLGMMCILVFALYIPILPVGGFSSAITMTGLERSIDILWHLLLPGTVLGLIQMALVSRMTRANMLEVLKLDYVTTARSKGLSERMVIFKHALRNALLPVVTMIGSNITAIIAGAILIETVFGWPGLGRLTYDSILRRDYPVISGIFLIVSIGVISINLIVDILYCFLDPRVRYG